MSLSPTPINDVPELTAQVARAAFPDIVVPDARTFEGLRAALRRSSQAKPAGGPTLPSASQARSRDRRTEIGFEILGARIRRLVKAIVWERLPIYYG